jgi:hypothetical protein
MNCRVIATSFSEQRHVRNHKQTTLKYPDHYQDITSSEQALQQIRDVVELAIHNDPGVPVDLIIVNNDVGYEPGNTFIRGLNDQQTRWGRIRTLSRSNAGWSFGAFAEAYATFPEYDYWLFTEDDILVGGDDYYKKLIERFEEDPATGFLALVQTVRHTYGIHAGGGVGLTHKRILDQVVKLHGSLPHETEAPGAHDHTLQYRHKVIINGEVPFTGLIHSLGYDVIEYGNGKEWNYRDNLCMPYYNWKHEI